jgi:hypothetical protein
MGGRTKAARVNEVKDRRFVDFSEVAPTVRSDNMTAVAINELDVDFTNCCPEIGRCSSQCATTGTDGRFLCPLSTDIVSWPLSARCGWIVCGIDLSKNLHDSIW